MNTKSRANCDESHGIINVSPQIAYLLAKEGQKNYTVEKSGNILAKVSKLT